MITAPQPTFSNTRTRYGLVARVLHWLLALLIFTAIGLALYTETLSQQTEEGRAALMQIFSLHKTIGVAAFFTALIRILWALTQTHPVEIHPERHLENFAAKLTHWMLYGAMVIMPLSGWIYHSATLGFAPILWPLPQALPFIPQTEMVAHAAEAVHKLSAVVLYIAIGLHVLGALKHVFIDKDGTIGRMTSGRPAGPAITPPSNDERAYKAPLLALLIWIGIIGFAAFGPDLEEEGRPAPQQATEQAAPEAAATTDAATDAAAADAEQPVTAQAEAPAPEPEPTPEIMDKSNSVATEGPAAGVATQPEAAPTATTDSEATDSPATTPETTDAATAATSATEATPAAQEGNWAMSEGTLGLTMTQMGSAVSGSFTAFTPVITYDEATRTGDVTVTIPIASLQLGSVTDQAMSADFFNESAFPEAVFKAAITPAEGEDTTQHIAEGTLTLKGMELPLTLPFTLLIEGDEAKMSGTTTLNRRDYNIGESYQDEATVAYAVDVAIELTAKRK